MHPKHGSRIVSSIIGGSVFFCILEFQIVAFAQPTTIPNKPTFSFQHLTIEDGLSQGMVTTIYQDRQGFMWFGTKAGLNRYDGYRFTVFENVPFDSTSLSNNYVETIFEDRRGRLWIGTVDGLNCFDPAAEKFRRFVHDPADPYSLGTSSITAIQEAPTPENLTVLWLGTAAGGLSKLMLRNEEAAPLELPQAMRLKAAKNTQPADHYFLRYQHRPDDPHSLSSNRIYDLLVDHSGVLWIATVRGLCRLDAAQALNTDDKARVNFIRYARPSKGTPGRFDNECRSLLETRDGLIWVGTERGLARIIPGSISATGAFENHDYPSELGLSQARKIIFEICEDRRSALWLATFQGLLVFDTNKETYQWIRHDSNDPASLSGSGVLSVFRDHSDAIWIGTAGYGLNQWAPRRNQFQKYTAAQLALHSNIDFSLTALLEDRRGLMWIFTSDEWYHFNRKTGRVAQRPVNFVPDEPQALHEDRAGFVWITNNAGAFRYNPRSERIEKIFPLPDKTKLELKLNAIYEDDKGDMWFGGTGLLEDTPDSSMAQPLSLYHWERLTGNVTPYPIPIPENADHRLMIIQILPARSGNFWLSTNNGLLRFHPQSGRLTIFQNDPEQPTSLTSNEVKTLLADPLQPDRFLWLGTNGGGLHRFDLAAESFSHYREEQGLPDNTVYGILCDNSGNLWMSTNKGLANAFLTSNTREVIKFKNYDVSHGLQSNEFNTNAFFKNAQGEMFFGGINGFNVFHPDSIDKNPHAPSVVFTDLQIKYHSVKPGEPGSPLRNVINMTEAITLSPHDNLFAIEFAALDLTLPGRNLFSYRLENFYEEWSAPSTRHRATYKNLRPGRYVFHVRGSNSDGVWNTTGARLAIEIKPHFYQTPWFAASTVLLLIGTLYGGYRWRLLYMENKQKELEAQVAERTLQLQDSETSVRSILDTVVEGIITIDESGRIERVNPEIERSFGYTAAELLDQNVNVLIPEPFVEVCEGYFAQNSKAEKQQGIGYGCEVTGKRKDGSTFPIEVRVSEAILNGRRHFIGVLHDIAARKQAEEELLQLNEKLEQRVHERTAALRQSEERYRVLYRSNPNMFFIVDSQGILLSVNQAGCDQLGYTAEELLGQPVFKLLHEEDREQAQKQLLVCLQNPQQPHTSELRSVRKNGSALWVSESARAIKDNQGEWVILIVCVDITAHLETELAVKESANRYHILFDEAPSPLWEIDMSAIKELLTQWHAQGIVDLRTFFDQNPEAIEQCLSLIKTLDVNQAARHLYQANSKEQLRFNARQIWNVESKSAFKDELIAVAAGKFDNEFETITQTLTGKKINVWVQWHVVPGHEQNLARVFIATIDITERKKMLDALQTSSARLRALSAHLQSSREQERIAIARDLHDDLGQALTALKMEMSVLQRKVGNAKCDVGGAAIFDDLEAMQSQAGGMIDYVRNLIKKLRPEILNTLGLLPALEWQLEDFHKRFGVAYKFHSKIAELNIASEHALAVYRIAQESLTNVARHAHAHQVAVKVEKQGEMLYVEIVDDGVGITQEDLDASGKFGLLGMRERALVFGGEVEIIGTAGRGTTVKIKVPLSEG